MRRNSDEQRNSAGYKEPERQMTKRQAQLEEQAKLKKKAEQDAEKEAKKKAEKERKKKQKEDERILAEQEALNQPHQDKIPEDLTLPPQQPSDEDALMKDVTDLKDKGRDTIIENDPDDPDKTLEEMLEKYKKPGDISMADAASSEKPPIPTSNLNSIIDKKVKIFEEQKYSKEELEALEAKKKIEDEEFKQYKEYRGFQLYLSPQKFSGDEMNFFRTLCKSRQPGCMAVYTHPDPSKPIGIIYSFVDQGKLIKVPISLDRIVYCASNPRQYLQMIQHVAEKQVRDPARLPSESLLFLSVQEGADVVVNLKKVAHEMRFWREWLDVKDNYADIAQFRKVLHLKKQTEEKVRIQDDSTLQRGRSKSQRKIQEDFERARKRKDIVDTRNQDFPMENTEGKEHLIDASYVSAHSDLSNYMFGIFQAHYHQQAMFTSLASEYTIRDEALVFWHKYGFMGELKTINLSGKGKGRVFLGSEIKKFCQIPGGIWVKRKVIKGEVLAKLNQRQKDQINSLRLEVMLHTIKMNYLGFNAFALVDSNYDKDKYKERQVEQKKVLMKAKNVYYTKDFVEKIESVIVIDFKRIEFAIDISGFLKGQPKPPKSLNQKQRYDFQKKLEDPSFENIWKRNSAATDQIASMVMMYNNLFDYSFFYNKLFMLQVMAIMRELNPLYLNASLQSKQFNCDLSDYYAFDNNWTFFQFQRVFHVDVEGRDPKVRKKLDEERKERKEKKNATKEFNKEQEEAAKTEAQRKQEVEMKQKEEAEKKRKKQEKEERKRRQIRNPDAQEFHKFQKDEVMKDVEKKKPKDKKVSPLDDIDRVFEFNSVQQEWHVFDYIIEQYENESYGPFIVQMTRKDAKKSWVTEYAVIKHIEGMDEGCVVLNYAGPQYIRFNQLDGTSFPLLGLHYYFSEKSIPKIPKDGSAYPDTKECQFNITQIWKLYRTCSIFTLKEVNEDYRNKEIKFRALSELIFKVGQSIGGGKEFLASALNLLKNPTNCKDYGQKGPQHIFIKNQDAYETIVMGRIAEQQFPDAALQAQIVHPYKDAGIYGPSTQQEYDEKGIKQNAKIQSFLQRCQLANVHGGIDISNGGFNGLLHLKYLTEDLHLNASHVIESAKKSQPNNNSAGQVDQSLKRKVQLNTCNEYVLEREVLFFLNTVATALITFMMQNRYNKDQMSKMQVEVLESVKIANNERLEVHDTLEEIVSLHSTKKQKLKALQMVEKYGEQVGKERCQDYFDKIAHAESNPQVKLAINEKFKTSIAYVLMTSRDDKRDAKSNPNEDLSHHGQKKARRKQKQMQKYQQPDTRNYAMYEFCVAQVLDIVGLRRMFGQVIRTYNPKILGVFKSDCSQQIQRYALNEMKLDIDDPNAENGKYCYTYDRLGNIVYNENNEILYRRYNPKQMVANWRFYGYAAIDINYFEGGHPPKKIGHAVFEINKYFMKEIFWQSMSPMTKDASTKDASTNESPARNGEMGVQFRIFKNETEENLNTFRELDTDAEYEEYTMDDKLKSKFITQPYGDGEDTLEFINTSTKNTQQPNFFKQSKQSPVNTKVQHQSQQPSWKSYHSTSNSYGGTTQKMPTFDRSRSRTPASTDRTPVDEMNENQRRAEQRIRDQEALRGRRGGERKYPFANQRKLDDDDRKAELARRYNQSESPDDKDVKKESKGKGKHQTPTRR